MSDLLSLKIRPRRNRSEPSIRKLIQETHLRASDFIAPFFLLPGSSREEKILTLPGVSRLSCDLILKKACYLHKQGIQAIALFPIIPEGKKCAFGKFGLQEDSFLIDAIYLLKKELPSLALITDIALDPYTSHGHDGLIDENKKILNDETIETLAKMALIHAQAGVDFVAPSDMMDGRIGFIRSTLDKHGFTHTGILSYCVKYASKLYGPFRDAVGSNLQFGDKRTYQMDPANSKEALLEALLDEQEGADILMIKPALFYLDIISKVKQKSLRPIAAYHVSGEYSMIKAAGKLGYLNEKEVLYEALLSIKRAGADLIFTYGVEEILDIIEN